METNETTPSRKILSLPASCRPASVKPKLAKPNIPDVLIKTWLQLANDRDVEQIVRDRAHRMLSEKVGDDEQLKAYIRNNNIAC